MSAVSDDVAGRPSSRRSGRRPWRTTCSRRCRSRCRSSPPRRTSTDPACSTVPTSAWPSKTPTFGRRPSCRFRGEAVSVDDDGDQQLANIGRTLARSPHGMRRFSLRRGRQFVEQLGTQEHRPAVVVGSLPHRRARRAGRRAVGLAASPTSCPPWRPGASRRSRASGRRRRSTPACRSACTFPASTPAPRPGPTTPSWCRRRPCRAGRCRRTRRACGRSRASGCSRPAPRPSRGAGPAGGRGRGRRRGRATPLRRRGRSWPAGSAASRSASSPG